MKGRDDEPRASRARRPARLRARVPWVWVRIVLASGIVTPIEKLVYSEERGLGGGRGATMGAGPLGLRLHLSRDTIERARRALVDYDLLEKQDLGAGRSAAWFIAMPKECRPEERRRRLTDDEVQAIADALDARIRAKCAQGGGMHAATHSLKVVRDGQSPAATLAADPPPLGQRNARRSMRLREPTAGREESEDNEEKVKSWLPQGKFKESKP